MLNFNCIQNLTPYKSFSIFLYPLCPMFGSKWNIYLSLYQAKFENKFYLFARFCFNVIWFVKCMKTGKLKIEIMSI